MKISILGGTFNPPHLGHILIAQQVLEFTPVEQVWLSPCFKHRFEKDLVSAQHRAEMTQFLTNGPIKYSGLEITNRFSGETIELMNFLGKKYPQHQFSFIIGSDNLIQFKKWSQWQKLVKNWPFLVFPRPDFSLDLDKYALTHPAYQFKIIKNPNLVTTNLSSTIIRSRVRKNLSIGKLVHQKVNLYIKKHQIYQ